MQSKNSRNFSSANHTTASTIHIYLIPLALYTKHITSLTLNVILERKLHLPKSSFSQSKNTFEDLF